MFCTIIVWAKQTGVGPTIDQIPGFTILTRKHVGHRNRWLRTLWEQLPCILNGSWHLDARSHRNLLQLTLDLDAIFDILANDLDAVVEFSNCIATIETILNQRGV
jgi:hypothetical protein